MHSKVDFVPPTAQALTLFFYAFSSLVWAFKWPAVLVGLAIQVCTVAFLIHISCDVCG